jgi:hypothetical protein
MPVKLSPCLACSATREACIVETQPSPTLCVAQVLRRARLDRAPSRPLAAIAPPPEPVNTGDDGPEARRETASADEYGNYLVHCHAPTISDSKDGHPYANLGSSWTRGLMTLVCVGTPPHVIWTGSGSPALVCT